ncbi:hypothetical protein [Ferrovibrio sp.]|uniref:hypothetical protein n=1 Tax=Ferrovibrio sp. TaxID=1917215 RepID=UPI003511B50E
MARGETAEEVARLLGCPPQRILRNLRRSRKFRLAIESAHARLRLAAQLRFALLGDLALSHLRQSERLDTRLLQWLGDRTGIAGIGDPEGVLAARLDAAMRPETVAPPRPGDPPRVIDAAALKRMLGEDD